MSMKIGNGLNLQNQRVVNLADGTAATDAVTKQQLDNALAGLAWKQPVRVATTANGALATAFAAAQTVDGVTLVAGDRILLKDQTAGSENGIYTVNGAGAPTRASDFDTAAEVINGTVYVRQGTVNADKAFTQTVDPVTIGTTSMVFAQVGGGTAYSAGFGLSLTGTTFAVVPKSGGGLSSDATGVFIDTTYSGLAKRFSANIGDGSATAIAVTHNLGTKDVHWSVRDATTDEFVLTDAVATSTTVVTFTFASAPTTNQYRVTIVA